MKKLVLHKIIYCLWLCLLACANLQAQVTITVSAIPSNTPQGDNIYIAGTFNNWNPNNSAYILQYNSSSNTYTISVPCSGTIQYKFTRGTSWATVEGDAQGATRPDRSFNCASGATVTNQILSWEDLSGGGGGGSTAAANVSVISNNFSLPQLSTTRRIWVYLPPDYQQNPNKMYPVMYMHDGQNLFDDLQSFAGEWGVDETLNQLFAQNGDPGCIVVGIDNGGANRLNEYSPWVNPTYGGGQGAQYISFLINTLKPYIDTNYRTLSGRENTAIGGSSMGGLISLYAALEHQNVFSKALIFSPAFWFSNQCFAQATSKGRQQPLKIYMLCGQNEGSNMATNQDAMRTTLLNAGFGANEVLSVKKADGQHAEWFWKREYKAGYQWLFANAAATTQDLEQEIQIITDAYLENVTVILPTKSTKAKLIITDMLGKTILKKSVENGEKLPLGSLAAGNYTIHIATKTKSIYKKVLKP